MVAVSKSGEFSGPAIATKDSEYRCPRCCCRVSRSPSDPTLEYGHKDGCPRRPDHFGYATVEYDPVADPLLLGSPEIVADGGRLTCDDCDAEIDPGNHKVLIKPSGFDDLCLDCQPHYDSERQYRPKENGGEP